jgi:membrane complex biogenesis BtpA family protein
MASGTGSGFAEKLKETKALIGVVHLKPLPGSPHAVSLQTVVDVACGQAVALDKAGFDAIIIENFGDAPFFKNRVPPTVISSMTRVALEIKKDVSLPLGINVLRNDGRAALSIAGAVDATFVRVNVYVGAQVTDQGLIEGEAADIARQRAIEGLDVGIFADIMVKHAAPLGRRSLLDEALEASGRAGADALILTGPSTGLETSIADVRLIREVLPDSVILVGSGINPVNVREYIGLADGFIIGSSIREEGKAGARLLPDRLEEMASAFRKAVG